MARIVAQCVCGSAVDVRTWVTGVRLVEWHNLHAHCAIAWQREHGLPTVPTMKAETDERH
jgi:hypothetical protein